MGREEGNENYLQLLLTLRASVFSLWIHLLGRRNHGYRMLQLDKEWRKAHVNSSLVGKFACKQLVRGKVMSCTKNENLLLG